MIYSLLPIPGLLGDILQTPDDQNSVDEPTTP